MYSYVDSSVALHALLPWGDDRAVDWLTSCAGEVCSSTLLELEIIRALRREQLPLDRADEVLDRVRLISIDDSILRSAGAIEPHVKSLDAIHLATCGLLGADVTLATHDEAMRRVALQLEYDVMDPLHAVDPGTEEAEGYKDEDS